ncbi:unnamed protein product [Mycena citricolor]|uniref:DUF4100 domain-containing protein n=1 Tax=Mycena citricolor TaxID=2018698 RepID=A0AAD2Q630_9AGAR|nr:unnamed protein product [Mycena citricolor]
MITCHMACHFGTPGGICSNYNIDSGSNRDLRPSEPRNLRLEFRAISQNPLNLSDAAHHTDSSSEDLLVPVPHGLPHHYNSDSPHSNLPTIDFLTDSLSSSQSSSPSFILRPISPSPSPPPPPPPPNQNMAAVVPMPARGARGAPEFDPSKPRELPRFFTDLEYHFGLAGIADAQERKRHALRFLPFDEAELWESLDSFSAPHNYDAWKAEVLKLYPGTDSDRKYATSDLHALIGKYASSGIHSRAEYSEFYRLFLVISKYLILKQRLSLVEQSRAFRTAIAPVSLWNRVHQRLQIKKPDVHPEDPYELGDMNEAVEFVLADSMGSFSFQTTAPPAASSPVTVKSEADPNSAILGEILKLLVAQNAARLGPLEREIWAVRTRQQARAAIEARDRSGDPTEAPEQAIRSTPPPARIPAPAVATPARAPVSAPAPAPAIPPTNAVPEHPYARARDAAYAPPQDRNFGARVPAPVAKKNEPAYRSSAPVYDEKHADAVFGRIMDTKIENSVQELMSISPEVRSRMRDATSSRRVAPAANGKTAAPPVSTNVYEQYTVDPLPPDAYIETLDEQKRSDARNAAFFDSMPAGYMNSALPPGAIIIPDYYETLVHSGAL